MSDRLIPLLIISVLLLIIDWYIFKALLSLKIKAIEKRRNTFSYLYWGYSVLLILGVFLGVYLNIKLTARAIILVAFFLTFVTKFFFLPFLFIDDIRRAFIWLTRKQAKENPLDLPSDDNKIPRSEFIVKSGLLVAAIPLASLSWGIASGAYDYQLTRRKLYLKNLPKAFHGLKLAQISDIHSGSFYNKKAVLGGVEMVLSEKPDLILFTGDLVNNLASEMKEYQDIFSKIKAPLGVYSVLGNHDYGDYYFGKEPSAAKAKNLEVVKSIHGLMGWDLLLDEHRKIKVDNEEIGILGCQNWGAGRFIQKGNLEKTLWGTDELPVKLLMSHDPSHWRAQVLQHPDIDVMFSGHTHGMQFGVKTKEFQWSPVEYIYKEWAGLYTEKEQQLYVNVGYGFLGYPGRVGILPEITIFELHRT
ncbi:metallophosphoesterase [Pedobacter sp. P351]|uniref:metallophosphoesterase n=1 Tax=Pedobacter superstes TaxID=3133441 RepID=UPI0030ACC658